MNRFEMRSKRSEKIQWLFFECRLKKEITVSNGQRNETVIVVETFMRIFIM